MESLLKQHVQEWGIEHLSNEERLEFVERIGKLLYQAVLARSLDVLSTPEEEELMELLDKPHIVPEDIFVFLDKKIPAFSMVVQEEVEKLKGEIRF